MALSRRPPSTRAKLLMKAREELSPDRSLASVDAASVSIVGAISVAATLISAFGLISATELAKVSLGWALPSVIFAAASAALAIWSTVPAFDVIAPGDLEDVDSYVTRQLRRRGLTIRAAALAFAAAVLLAPLPALVAAVNDPEPAWDVATWQKGSTTLLSVKGEGLDDNAAVELRLGDSGRLLAHADVEADKSVAVVAAVPSRQLPDPREAIVTLLTPGKPEKARKVPLPASSP